jgi:beta-glucanase (GH16 family)
VDYGGTSRRTFKYGYFEMRAKLPKGKGVWPAFWLTNDKTAEIDIMELIGQDPKSVYMTHHVWEGEHWSETVKYTGADFSAGYHTFAVDWQPTYLRYYVDGVLRAQFTQNIPSDPLWIVANTCVGDATSWPGAPDATTTFPQYFDIDYIRVFATKADAAEVVVPPVTTTPTTTVTPPPTTTPTTTVTPPTTTPTTTVTPPETTTPTSTVTTTTPPTTTTGKTRGLGKLKHRKDATVVRVAGRVAIIKEAIPALAAPVRKSVTSAATASGPVFTTRSLAELLHRGA